MSIVNSLLFETNLVDNNLTKLESTLLLKDNISTTYYDSIPICLHSEIYSRIAESSIKQFQITFQSYMKLFKKILGVEAIRISDKIVIRRIIKKYEEENEENKVYTLKNWKLLLKLRNKTVHHFDEKLVEQWISKIREYIKTDFKETIILIKERNPEI